MCGLCGLAGNLSYNLEQKVFRDMLDVCQVRGRDSTGVFKVRKDNSYTWVKNIGPPSNLVDHRIYDQTLGSSSAKIMAGHTRSKTVGEISVKNAHPFDVEGRFVGMHNGTLRNHHSLDTHENGLVDSEVLMRHIAKHGAKKTFSEIKGAWACVWYDQYEETLNFIRNNERPLYLVRNEAGDLLAWASEPWMFGALGRATKLGEIIALAEDTWLSYPIPAGTTDIGKAKTAHIDKAVDKVEDFTSYGTSWLGTHVFNRKNGVGNKGSNVTPLHIPNKNAANARNKEALDPFSNKPLVTIRDVGGMQFITNAHTGREYSLEKFLTNCNGQCCFCNGGIEHLENVAEMFSEQYVICKGCFDECYGEEVLAKNKKLN